MSPHRRTRRALVALACVLLVGVALTAGSGLAAANQDAARDADASAQQTLQECAASSPPDHADPDGGTDDTIGWVDGYWYDEPIALETSDGLNESEHEQLTARTAARVETIRCLSFEERPPVEVQTRSEYADQLRDELETESQRTGTLLNATTSTMFLIDRDDDWHEVQASVLTSGVGAYYDPDEERISMIVETGDEVPREAILAHELVHALQDQHRDLDRFDASLQSRFDAERGVVEGEATLVEEAYTDRCEAGEWSDPCVAPSDQQLPDLPENVGAVLLFQQPYMFGPSFVEAQRGDTGWDGVGAIYDEMPEHSLHVVAPDTYGEVEVTIPEVEDRSDGDWERVTAEQRPDHEVVGQAALTTMFVAPALDSRVDGQVVPTVELYDPASGRTSDFDVRETSGWRGDRLVAYTDGDRHATVWVLEWTNGTEAQRFADAYEELLGVYGGEREESGAYVFGEDSRFDRAVSLQVDDDRVRVVTAPSVAALGDVDDVQTDGADDDDDDGDGLPGPGVLVALVVLLAVALLAVRRTG